MNPKKYKKFFEEKKERNVRIYIDVTINKLTYEQAALSNGLDCGSTRQRAFSIVKSVQKKIDEGKINIEDFQHLLSKEK